MNDEIAAYLAKQAAKPRPMETKFIGRNATPVIVASDGSMYMQPVKGGAFVRVAVNHATGEAVKIVPWSKARRKAEKRKMHAQRAIGMPHARCAAGQASHDCNCR